MLSNLKTLKKYQLLGTGLMTSQFQFISVALKPWLSLDATYFQGQETKEVQYISVKKSFIKIA